MECIYKFANAGTDVDPIDLTADTPYALVTCCVCYQDVVCNQQSSSMYECAQCKEVTCYSCIVRLSANGFRYFWYACPVCRYDSNGVRKDFQGDLNVNAMSKSDARLLLESDRFQEALICHESLVAIGLSDESDMPEIVNDPREVITQFRNAQQSATAFFRRYHALRREFDLYHQ